MIQHDIICWAKTYPSKFLCSMFHVPESCYSIFTVPRVTRLRTVWIFTRLESDPELMSQVSRVSPGVECLSSVRWPGTVGLQRPVRLHTVLLLLLFQTFRRQDQRLALKTWNRYKVFIYPEAQYCIAKHFNCIEFTSVLLWLLIELSIPSWGIPVTWIVPSDLWDSLRIL